MRSPPPLLEHVNGPDFPDKRQQLPDLHVGGLAQAFRHVPLPFTQHHDLLAALRPKLRRLSRLPIEQSPLETNLRPTSWPLDFWRRPGWCEQKLFTERWPIRRRVAHIGPFANWSISGPGSLGRLKNYAISHASTLQLLFPMSKIPSTVQEAAVKSAGGHGLLVSKCPTF